VAAPSGGQDALPSRRCANLWSPEKSAGAYRSLDAFMTDVVEVLRDEVRELVRLGCTYIQLDAPHYPLLIDPAWRAFYESRGWPMQRWLSYGVELDIAVIDAGRPATFGFHLCRGNQLSRWLVVTAMTRSPVGLRQHSRGPAAIGQTCGARAPLTPSTGARRQGGRAGPRPRKRPGRIRAGPCGTAEQAGTRIGSDRMAISPQCGFATSAAGNAITPEAQRAKLALLVRVAQDVLGP
jgi:5-methyltetrahydropteroyltriglutamate--homocysteine methyltransferase